MISCWSKWRPWRWKTPTWDKSSRTTRIISPSWRPRPLIWRYMRSASYLLDLFTGCLESKSLKEWIAAIIAVIRTPSNGYYLNPRPRMLLFLFMVIVIHRLWTGIGCARLNYPPAPSEHWICTWETLDGNSEENFTLGLEINIESTCTCRLDNKPLLVLLEWNSFLVCVGGALMQVY